MKDRFTHEARVERGRIRPQVRAEVYARDDHSCQYCGQKLAASALTIDHLVPLALGGVDEVVNYVTACQPCNERKAASPLAQFAASLSLPIGDLPVHGDPIIDNERLPLQIRLVRKRVFDAMRRGDIRASGKQFQKTIEKEYRRSFWNTPAGQELERSFPSLPGHVRVMVPEIQTIAGNQRDFLLLVELAKSANTRNLIGSTLTADAPVETIVRNLAANSRDDALRKRLVQALRRFESIVRERARDP